MIKALTVLGFLILGYDAADFTITGIAVLAVVVLLIAAWAAGVFTARFWVCDDATSAQCDADDVELDRLYPPVPARTINHHYVDVTDYPEVRS